MPETITIAAEETIATVTLRSPAMAPAFFSEIEAAFRALADDTSVRVVVVRGAEKAFSYGLDLPAAFQEYGHYFAGGTAATRMELWSLIRKMQSSFNAIASCPVPVIACVHGPCIGGGLDLVSACDIRLCSADARFSLRETKLAIVADLGSLQRLPALIGEGATRELAFTGKDIGAERALSLGLVSEVYANREALDAGAMGMAREIANNPPLTVRGVKQVLDHGLGKPAADGLAYVAAWNSAFLASGDLGEALSAFTEKRAPRFEGK